MDHDQRNAKHEHHGPEQKGERGDQHRRPTALVTIRVIGVVVSIESFITHQAENDRLDKTIQNRDEQQKKCRVVPPDFGTHSQGSHHQAV